jgi:hypothetical protein
MELSDEASLLPIGFQAIQLIDFEWPDAIERYLNILNTS